MGYRTYIGSIPKKEYNKIKSLTKDELYTYKNLKYEDGYEPYIGVYDFVKESYEFGKYTDFDPPKKSMKKFFKKKDLQERYIEYDFYIVTPEFLEYIINSYKNRIATYYNDMMDPFFGKKDTLYSRDNPTDFLNSIKTEYSYPNNKYKFDFTKITDEEQTALFKILEHIRSMRVEWVHLTPFDLKNNNDSITDSWKYEYGIFELVRTYKTFDWKRNNMVYYGY